MHRRTLLHSSAALLATATLPVWAHAPSLHGFSMVSFKRPFPAPAFSAAALDGGTLSLSEFRGRYVLLNFWATWCPPCLEEMPSMDTLYKHFKARKFAVLAISSDKEGASIVKGFIDKLGVSFPIALDPDGRVAAVYGARNLPMSILVNPEGQVEAAAQGARDWASKEAFEVIGERLAPA